MRRKDQCECFAFGACKGIHKAKQCPGTQVVNKVMYLNDVPKEIAASGTLLIHLCDECADRLAADPRGKAKRSYNTKR